MAELPADEAGEEGQGDDGEPDRRPGEPAVPPGLRDRVDEGGEAGGDEHRARQVEGLHAGVAALVEQDRRENDREHPDGDVDEEDPLPAEGVGEDPAHENSRGGAEAAHCAPDTERDVPLAPFMERRGQDGERRGSDDRRAEPLERTRRDERRLRPGQAGEERREGEDDEAAQEDPSAPEEVSRPASEEQESSEEERVRADHPLQVLLREPEIDLDRRQRDIHDGDVQDDHELDDAEERQCQPLPFCRCGHVRPIPFDSVEIASNLAASTCRLQVVT